MADEPSEEKKPETEQLQLKVVTQDGNEIFFKVRAGAASGSCAAKPSPFCRHFLVCVCGSAR